MDCAAAQLRLERGIDPVLRQIPPLTGEGEALGRIRWIGQFIARDLGEARIGTASQ